MRSPLVSMGPSLLEERRRQRTHRLAAIGIAAAVLGVLALVWLIASLSHEVVVGNTSTVAASVSNSRTPAPIASSVGRPAPVTLAAVTGSGAGAGSASQPDLKLQLPINRKVITGIGYDHRPDPSTMTLAPEGERANLPSGQRLIERFLATSQPSGVRWFLLADHGGDTNVVYVGTQPGAEVYAPLTGTITAISDYVVADQPLGKVVQIQPLGDGETVVVLRDLDADPGLAVGQTVSQGTTHLGTVRSMGDSLHLPLARYTHDDGTSLELYVQRVHAAGLGHGSGG